MNPPPLFDDFLGLLAEDLARVRTLVLHGRSGSGKSTTLRHLLGNRPEVFGEDPVVLDARPMGWAAAADLRDRTVLVDEVLRQSGGHARECTAQNAPGTGRCPWSRGQLPGLALEM